MLLDGCGGLDGMQRVTVTQSHVDNKCCLLCRMIDGQRKEPLEEVVCEIEDEFTGPVIDALSLRRGEVHLLSFCMALPL